MALPTVKCVTADGKALELPDGARFVFVSSGDKDIKLDRGMYDTAYKAGKTLSQYLEEMSPSDRDDRGQVIGLDAFDRQLKLRGIVPRSIPAAGVFASNGDRFFSGDPSSVILWPEFINRIARMKLMAPDVVDGIVAVTRPITGDTFKSVNVTFEEADVKTKRTVEGTPFPLAKISWADVPKSVAKYGRTIQVTYEFVRRCPLDMLGTIINLVMQQSRVSQMDDVVKVLRAACTTANKFNMNGATGFDPDVTAGATVRKMSFFGWLGYAASYYPYVCDTLIGNIGALKAFVTMEKPNLDPWQVLDALNQGPRVINTRLAQNIWGPVALFYNKTMPANEFITIQREYAVERIVEVGADLTETQRIMREQFQEINISECLAFSVMFPDVVKQGTIN